MTGKVGPVIDLQIPLFVPAVQPHPIHPGDALCDQSAYGVRLLRNSGGKGGPLQRGIHNSGQLALAAHHIRHLLDPLQREGGLGAALDS